jgi:hypothetical protein
VAKKIGGEREKKEPTREPTRETREEEPTVEEEGEVHNFEIEIDSDGNMYLKKIVRLPILGTKIEP